MDTIFPLEQLIGFKDNIYMITVAASRRAYQMREKLFHWLRASSSAIK